MAGSEREARLPAGLGLDDVASLVLVVDRELRIRYVNSTCAAAGGLSGDALVGNELRAVLPVDAERGAVVWRLGELLKGVGGEWECHWGTDGARRVAWSAKTLVLGSETLLVSAGFDITERWDSQRAWRESEEEHRIVLSNISDAVFITDDTGDFTFICPNVDVIFGYSFAEVRALGNIASLLGNALVDRQQLDQAGEIQNLEQEIRDKDGQVHILLVNVKRVAIKHGTRLYTCRDVTARKQVEESLREYQSRLAQASRLSSMGVLTSGLAHELNQPLAAISNFSQACIRRIRGGACKSEELLEHLEQVSAQAYRAGDIIQRLRQLVRTHSPHNVVVDVPQMVREAVQLVELAARKHGVAIEVEAGDDLPTINADSTGVQQVLLNLVLNALDALEQADRDAPRVAIRVWQSGPKEVEFAVADNGPGLSAEELAQVFDPFYTTKSEGMGLGLAISQSIIERHGGRLWATPNDDGGVTFRFALPTARIPGRIGPAGED